MFNGVVNLKDATLDTLRGAVMAGCDFAGVDLAGVDLSGVDVNGATFNGVLNLKDATLDNLRGAVMAGCDFAGVDLAGVDLSGASLRNVDFAGAAGMQQIVLGTNRKHTADVRGCKHAFPQGNHYNIEPGTVIIYMRNLLTKSTSSDAFNRIKHVTADGTTSNWVEAHYCHVVPT